MLLLLFTEVSLDLVSEEQHSQLTVRGLVHGLGLHAHAVLIRREFVSTVFLMPEVKQASQGCSNHQEVTVKILPVEVDVLAPPAFNVDVEASYTTTQHMYNMTTTSVGYLVVGNQ